MTVDEFRAAVVERACAFIRDVGRMPNAIVISGDVFDVAADAHFKSPNRRLVGNVNFMDMKVCIDDKLPSGTVKVARILKRGER